VVEVSVVEVVMSDAFVVVGWTACTVVVAGLADSPRGQRNHTPIARTTANKPTMAVLAMLR
jgi:hypothetical protein